MEELFKKLEPSIDGRGRRDAFKEILKAEMNITPLDLALMDLTKKDIDDLMRLLGKLEEARLFRERFSAEKGSGDVPK